MHTVNGIGTPSTAGILKTVSSVRLYVLKGARCVIERAHAHAQDFKHATKYVWTRIH